MDGVGWCKDNSEGKTHEVGRKRSNAWGLHDMHGNVKEWCLDWFGESLTGGKDPQGPADGESRVFKGGGCVNIALDCRSAERRGYVPSKSDGFDLGFRVCLSRAR
ncbi:MAG: SUMF1/EgtB/PvdO family nonheme iron enzyme, partial [Verrucomicrobiae bacterium]|nr:SUMF1/EgtB/PvdO family nonheme iron enzyme [Verrucomicrobiae bacterium]